METGTEEIIRTIREDPFLSVMFSCYERAGEYAWDKTEKGSGSHRKTLKALKEKIFLLPGMWTS